MKKLLLGSLLTVAVAFAQAGGGSTCKAPKTGTGKKLTKPHTRNAGRKGTEKEKKGKKGSGGTTTPPPK